ncbi:MAG: V-type ATP synthase subunit D [Clostridia bacterium]|nr:V-type ATP synthase subunit D [Clostridia bacterium]
MDTSLFPTKSNLMLAKNSLRLSKHGYELLDKKRNVLIREMMELIDEAKSVQSRIDETFATAYKKLSVANITMGSKNVEQVANSIKIDNSIKVVTHSVMGVEVPKVVAAEGDNSIPYGAYSTNQALDEAYKAFAEVRKLTVELAEVETAVCRLAVSIKKTQKRANSLKNITIPKYEQTVKDIQSALEEKDREEFSRLKVIKKVKS